MIIMQDGKHYVVLNIDNDRCWQRAFWYWWKDPTWQMLKLYEPDRVR